jgi:hypothetical protein
MKRDITLLEDLAGTMSQPMAFGQLDTQQRFKVETRLTKALKNASRKDKLKGPTGSSYFNKKKSS